MIDVFKIGADNKVIDTFSTFMAFMKEGENQALAS